MGVSVNLAKKSNKKVAVRAGEPHFLNISNVSHSNISIESFVTQSHSENSAVSVIVPIKKRFGRPEKPVDESTYSGRFAVRLRKLRDERGLTNKQLAEMSGIPKGTIEIWCSGNSVPSLEQMPPMAKALNLKVSELFPE